jgi:exosortase
MTEHTSPPVPRAALGHLSWILASLAVLWAYWPLLVEMSDRWRRSPEYSHGWLVPLFALVLLWLRRDPNRQTAVHGEGWVLLALGIGAGLFGPEGYSWLAPASAAAAVCGAAILIADWRPATAKPEWPGGLFLLLSGCALQLFATHFFMEWFMQLSLLPIVAGMFLLLGGSAALRWSWPAIGFLFFMIPLPHTLEVALRGPLRELGTTASTFIMQTCGLPAFAEGTIITVDDHQIGVVEACSGLRMLMIFFALSAAVALLAERPFWQRALIVLGAVPIALIANVARITSTGILHVYGYDRLADLTFHDLAGWLMMPLGLALLWAELWYLDHLFIVEDDKPMQAGLSTATILTSEDRRFARTVR